jgi:hypothetical protein
MSLSVVFKSYIAIVLSSVIYFNRVQQIFFVCLGRVSLIYTRVMQKTRASRLQGSLSKKSVCVLKLFIIGHNTITIISCPISNFFV